ncbi:MAG: peptidoglycan-binding domain-containing protein [Pseudomonadota bacterium]
MFFRLMVTGCILHGLSVVGASAQSECDAEFLGRSVDDMFTEENAQGYANSGQFRQVFEQFEMECGGTDLFLDSFLSLDEFLYNDWLYDESLNNVDEQHLGFMLAIALVEERPEVITKLIQGIEGRIASGDDNFRFHLGQLDTDEVERYRHLNTPFFATFRSGYSPEIIEPLYEYLDQFDPEQSWQEALSARVPAAHLAYIEEACLSDSYTNEGAFISATANRLVLDPEQVAKSLSIVESNLFSAQKKHYPYRPATSLVANLYSGCRLHQTTSKAQLDPPTPIPVDHDKSLDILMRLVREDTGSAVDLSIEPQLTMIFDIGIGTRKNPELAALLGLRPIGTPFSFNARKIVLTENGIGGSELFEADFYKTLSRETVSIMQRELSQLGLYRGTIDGLAGPRFMEAISSAHEHCLGIGVEANELCQKYFAYVSRDQVLSAID